jgi:hypothetical protein
MPERRQGRELLPGDHHIPVHLLELLLGDIEGVGRGVELVGLEALVAQGDREGLIILLQTGLAGESRQRAIDDTAVDGRRR